MREPDISARIDKEFWEAFKATYPNIESMRRASTYNDLLDKFRTALLGNAGADGGAPADPGRCRIRRQGLSASR